MFDLPGLQAAAAALLGRLLRLLLVATLSDIQGNFSEAL